MTVVAAIATQEYLRGGLGLKGPGNKGMFPAGLIQILLLLELLLLVLRLLPMFSQLILHHYQQQKQHQKQLQQQQHPDQTGGKYSFMSRPLRTLAIA